MRLGIFVEGEKKTASPAFMWHKYHVKQLCNVRVPGSLRMPAITLCSRCKICTHAAMCQVQELIAPSLDGVTFGLLAVLPCPGM